MDTFKSRKTGVENVNFFEVWNEDERRGINGEAQQEKRDINKESRDGRVEQEKHKMLIN